MKMLLTIGAALAAVLGLDAAEAQAEQSPSPPPTFHSPSVNGASRSASPFGARSAPDHGGQRGGRHRGRFHGGFFPGFILVEREVPVIIEREVVVREVAAAPALPPPPPAPRKPYVIGKSYASLPGGCMKMIEGGVSYYYCGGGEWYRLVGSGSRANYKAIAKP